MTIISGNGVRQPVAVVGEKNLFILDDVSPPQPFADVAPGPGVHQRTSIRRLVAEDLNVLAVIGDDAVAVRSRS
jgi:hypothetical protein